MFTHAITRLPAKSYDSGITTANLGQPNLEETLKQHQAYCQALNRAGAEIHSLPAAVEFPDSVFVEDTAIVTKDFAVLCNPGAESRRGETPLMAPTISTYFKQIFKIESPGTVDGGDICQTEDHFLIGLSERTNPEGARQLSVILEQNGKTSETVDIRETGHLLHLKSGIAYLGENTMLLDERLSNHPAFENYRKIIVPAEEAYAGNSLRFNAVVFVPKGFPKTEALIREAGFETVVLDTSEYRKMDGGLSCLSLRW